MQFTKCLKEKIHFPWKRGFVVVGLNVQGLSGSPVCWPTLQRLVKLTSSITGDNFLNKIFVYTHSTLNISTEPSFLTGSLIGNVEKNMQTTAMTTCRTTEQLNYNLHLCPLKNILMHKKHKHTDKTNEVGENDCGAQNISYRKIHFLQN